MKVDQRPFDLQEEVYPLHKLDDIKSFRNHVIWMMRFNDVLDVEKLADALSGLLEIGDWKKLGGRLRFKADGKLEVHFQKSSATRERNVFFTHVSYEVRIQDHPVASRLPDATDGPSTNLVSEDFRPFIARADFPTFDQSIRQNEPQISLHVTSFNDATLVGLSWPHVLMDASAGKALLSGWTYVLAGRENDVPLVTGARDDVLLQRTMSEKAETSEEFELEKHRLSGFGLLVFQLRCLWDKFWNYPRQQRTVFIPAAVLNELTAEIRQEIAGASQSSGQDVPFVSESDILIAWICQAAASTMPSPHPMAIMSFLDLRPRIPRIRKSAGVFLQNMVLSTYTFLSAQTARGPIGAVAVSHRRHFAEQATEKQTICFLKSVYRDIDAAKNPRLFFGEPSAVPLLINNVSKAELIKLVDFSPAVLHQGDSSQARKNPVGTMVTYWNEGLERGWSGFNVCWMQGRDYDGNFWMMANLLPQAWAKLEDHLRRLYERKLLDESRGSEK